MNGLGGHVYDFSVKSMLMLMIFFFDIHNYLMKKKAQ